MKSYLEELGGNFLKSSRQGVWLTDPRRKNIKGKFKGWENC